MPEVARYSRPVALVMLAVVVAIAAVTWSAAPFKPWFVAGMVGMGVVFRLLPRSRSNDASAVVIGLWVAACVLFIVRPAYPSAIFSSLPLCHVCAVALAATMAGYLLANVVLRRFADPHERMSRAWRPE